MSRASWRRRRRIPFGTFVILGLGCCFFWKPVRGRRSFPGLSKLEEEKGRPVSVGEYLAHQYIKAQQQAALDRTSAGRMKPRRVGIGGRPLPRPPVTTAGNANFPASTATIGDSTQAFNAVDEASATAEASTPTVPVPSSEMVADERLPRAAELPNGPYPSVPSSASDRSTEFLLQPYRELPKLAHQAARAAYHRLLRIVLYQPPVGVVSLWLALRFLRNLDGFAKAFWSDSLEDSASATPRQPVRQPTFHQIRRQYTSRAWNLDRLDGQYAASGGVQSVRQRLCVAALLSLEESTSTSSSGSTNNASPRLLLDALRVSAHPATPRLEFVHSLAGPLSRLRLPVASTGREPPVRLAAAHRIAYWTCQVRMMDAALRLLRQRLLQTCVRLARTEAHWRRRIQAWERRGVGWSSDAADSSPPQPTASLLSSTEADSSPRGSLLQSLGKWQPWRRRLEEDRLQWACAQAAFRCEVAKLGRVAHMLLQEPPDLDPVELLPAAKASELATLQSGSFSTNSSSLAPGRRFDFLPRYSVRWVADGRGHLSVRRLDAPASATLQISPSVWRTLENDVDASRCMQAWVQQSQRVICQVLEESMETSVDRNESDLKSLERAWCLGPTLSNGREEELEYAWRSIIHLCDSLASWRRVGEGRSVRLFDTALVGWTRRFDFLGIPSSMVYFRLATLVHSKLEPFLPTLRGDAIKGLQKAKEILQQRVWVPVQEIIMEIMNQGKGMMSAFSLQDEQVSLDRMLRDLGLGDGSPEQRKLGLQQATEQYEDILQRSMFTNLVRGRLVRLMLIQVQQLKVGLLSALDTIDVLMAGNRVNLYLLATVPALGLAYYSTRFLLRFLYNVRAKDIRPVTFAHADMAEYLEAIESILLSSDSSKKLGRNMDPQSLLLPPSVRLDSWELGQVVLYMHRYLLLLEFGSPPFPSSECEQIHERLRQVLHHPGLRLQGDDDLLNDQHLVKWFATIQRKHRGLLPSL